MARRPLTPVTPEFHQADFTRVVNTTTTRTAIVYEYYELDDSARYSKKYLMFIYCHRAKRFTMHIAKGIYAPGPPVVADDPDTPTFAFNAPPKRKKPFRTVEVLAKFNEWIVSNPDARIVRPN